MTGPLADIAVERIVRVDVQPEQGDAIAHELLKGEPREFIELGLGTHVPHPRAQVGDDKHTPIGEKGEE